MANVAERGQLILITGLAMAIGFVALALLLNTAIYTENLASRGSDVGSRDAVEFRQTSAEGVRMLLEEENDLEYDSRSAVRDNVTDGIDEFDRLRSIRAAENGVVVDLSELQVHEGTVLRQSESTREMENVSNDHNWTLSTGANGVENFSVTTHGGLESTSTPGSEAFNISLVGSGGNRWSLYLYEDGGNRIAVRNGSESISTDVCSSVVPSSPPFTVDLTEGTVDGAECSAIEFGKGTTPPYDVRYTWGNRSRGTYNLTVNSTTTYGFSSFGSSTEPKKIPVVYGVTFDLTYVNAELTYRDRVKVVQEEST